MEVLWAFTDQEGCPVREPRHQRGNEGRMGCGRIVKRQDYQPVGNGCRTGLGDDAGRQRAGKEGSSAEACVSEQCLDES